MCFSYTSLKGIIEGQGQEKSNHEYQQSVSDLDNLIDAISIPGDLILDPFAGSGTSGIAAILKSRKCILIEEDEEDCNSCRARLKDAIKERDKLLGQTPSVSETCLRLADKITDESGDIPVAM